VDLDAELAGTDLVIVLQDHRACDLDQIARDAPLILDTRGRIVSPRAEVL
jgi:UDP-N-acetyl-D-glucosamine dehydrogenase